MKPSKPTRLSASSSAWRHAEADAAWPTRPESLEIIMGSDKHSDAHGLDPVDPPRKKRSLGDVDYMRAAQLYSAASMRGSLLALHR